MCKKEIKNYLKKNPLPIDQAEIKPEVYKKLEKNIPFSELSEDEVEHIAEVIARKIIGKVGKQDTG